MTVQSPSKICPHCNKSFAHKDRVFCSRSCATSVSAVNRGRPLWEPEAIAYLKEVVGTAPAAILIKQFNRHAKKQGWASRTEMALLVKLKRLGMSRKATEDGWTVRELARILDVYPERVRSWVCAGRLKSCKSRNLWSVSQANFKAFARQHPNLLRGIESDRLMYTIDDAKLVSKIVALGTPTQGHPMPIKRLDTEEVYPSIKAAAKACFLHPNSIRLAVRLNRSAGGIQFQLQG